ncbi:unnamed protein product [Closterium sp. NIES-53]
MEDVWDGKGEWGGEGRITELLVRVGNVGKLVCPRGLKAEIEEEGRMRGGKREEDGEGKGEHRDIGEGHVRHRPARLRPPASSAAVLLPSPPAFPLSLHSPLSLASISRTPRHTVSTPASIRASDVAFRFTALATYALVAACAIAARCHPSEHSSKAGSSGAAPASPPPPAAAPPSAAAATVAPAAAPTAAPAAEAGAGAAAAAPTAAPAAAAGAGAAAAAPTAAPAAAAGAGAAAAAPTAAPAAAAGAGAAAVALPGLTESAGAFRVSSTVLVPPLSLVLVVLLGLSAVWRRL